VSALVCGATPVEFETLRERPFEGAPVAPFCTVTVKLPAANAAAPLITVGEVLESAVLAIVHGAHPDPLNVTRALFGSNPVPVIENVNACPLMGAFGVVVIPASWIAPALEFATVRDRPFERAPDPFCTKTVKLPKANVAVPLNVAEVTLERALLAMVQGVHPGPLNSTTALFWSKLEPLSVNANAFPSTG
jgi:hypothetical protein